MWGKWNAKSPGGFISGYGRRGKMSCNQNRRWRMGEWGMVHGGQKCVVENKVEHSVVVNDSRKTMMSPMIGPTS